MQIHLRRARASCTSSLALLLLAFVAIPSRAAEKTRLRVDDYQIDVELTPICIRYRREPRLSSPPFRI